MAKICKCSSCGREFDFGREGVTDRAGEPYCDSCSGEVETTCAFCEEGFLTPEAPEETFFCVAEGYAAEVGVPAGIYRVIRFPYYIGNVIEGMESLIEEAVERIAPPPPGRRGCQTGLICRECYESALSFRPEAPRLKPLPPQPIWIEPETDGMGRCFSDADPGL